MSSASTPVSSEPAAAASQERAAAFIARWKASSGSERSNYISFLNELTDLLEVPRPDPATADNARNAYVFERAIEMTQRGTTGYIDLYKRGCFVCETKQGVERDEEQAALSDKLRERRRAQRKGHGIRGTAGFDQVLIKARNQAEGYARNLPADEGRPPFLIVADVGHSFELFAEFTRSGGVYTPFPDASSHRIHLADLQRPEIRERLRLVWTDPLSLDPARRTAAVTREVAAKLAALSRSLEASAHEPRAAAYFLIRCIFTMFSEDVELLPKGSFSELLKSLRGQVHIVPSMLEHLWKAMDSGEFFPVLWFRQKLLRFNGGLFRDPRALAITEDQLELLIEAAACDWRDVEPAIFGTLLERALEPTERHKLGAHYTPRAYVERLVLPTVIEPLRADWQAVQAAAAQLANEDKEKQARQEIETFHRHLCHIRVLDPACGTGNFLYVTLEHLKRLEGEVLDTLERFGGNRSLEIDTATVRPSQMLGIEINPRAAVIAELVLWIGYLQWHLRTSGDVRTVSEPVLEDARNIETRDAILAYDDQEIVRDEAGRPKTHWDGRTTKPHPVTGRPVPDESAQVPLYRYKNPRPAPWPQADFIVGNPPFIGTKRMRDALGDGYVDAVRKTYSAQVEDNADYVMYWWHHAAEAVRQGHTRRFGFVTTNSLRQTFNRRVLENHLNAGPSLATSRPSAKAPAKDREPLSLIFAIPDHPWVDDIEAAAVRVAMTVGQAGNTSGLLQTVDSEEGGDESYKVTLAQRVGKIAADLTIGANITSAVQIAANSKISVNGVALHGSGFILTPPEAEKMRWTGNHCIKPYLGGIDLLREPRERYLIDFSFLTEAEARHANPVAFQHVIDTVKPERDQNRRDSIRNNWWRFAWERPVLRRALEGLPRYIGTTETAKHRVFQFLSGAIVPDHMIIAIALADAFHLGVLSSRIHTLWAMASGGTLEDRPRYNKSRCFETFPFPDCTEAQKARIRELGDALDAHRKARQAAHPDLTMTGMYNVLEKLRSGTSLTPKEKTIHEQGLVSILKQLHDDLDAAVADAYGWSADLNEEEILTRLVALNHERAAEEKRGHIRWLRPEYQAKDEGGGKKEESKAEQAEIPGLPSTSSSKLPAPSSTLPSKAPWPKALPEQIRAVRLALETLAVPANGACIAKLFTGARKDRIEAILESLQALGHAQEVEDGRYSA